MVKTYWNVTSLDFLPKPDQSGILVFGYYLNQQQLRVNLDFQILKNNNFRIIILARLDNQSQLHLTTTQNHTQVSGTSDLLCKAIIDQDSQFRYYGKVVINKIANQAHAYQRNENLILDPGSTVISEPSLEIKANDVFCTHGSFTSYLDPLELYYLQTRGVSLKVAEQLLTKGFLLSGLDRLLLEPTVSANRLENLRQELGNYLLINH